MTGTSALKAQLAVHAKATCQHGSSALSRIQDLDSAIIVAIFGSVFPFTISATVHTSTDFERSTEHKLTTLSAYSTRRLTNR